MNHKLNVIYNELRSLSLASTDSDKYWEQIEGLVDNATDSICNMDDHIKRLIDYIEEK